MRRVSHFLICVILTFAYIDFSDSITEREILLQFKDKIIDDPYNSLASWVSIGDDDLCNSFNGVSCNQEGFVDKIVLWNTSLAGTLTPALSGLTSLRVLTLFGNRFTGNLPLDYSKLQTLWKINVSSNALSGFIPEFIGDLPNLRFLDLSKNGFVGEIPDSLFKLCYKTKFVSLSHNNLSGSIPESIVNCKNLIGFDLSYNSITGLLPRICDIPVLEFVSVRRNVLSGDVFEEISKCKRLSHFDIGSNSFEGLVSFEVLVFKNMTYFNVSGNRFSGEIGEIVGGCSESLEFLDASSNELTGNVPNGVTECKSLKLLDLEANRLNGSVPIGIVKMEKLSVIRLGDNSIDGKIPQELGNLEFLQVLNLRNLNLTGEIPEDISNCRLLLELDVSGNALEGEIPKNLFNLTNLEILDLHRNRINGSIPSNLGSLSRIEFLDLSENLLSGPIPSSLGNLNRLTHFNVSYNNLSGVIPKIQASEASSFSNNPFLCGDPLETSCSSLGTGSRSRSRKTKALSTSVIIVIIAAALILVGVFIVLVLNLRARKRRKKHQEEEGEVVTFDTTTTTTMASTESGNVGVTFGKLVLFGKNLPSKYEDWEAGTKALLDKDNVIGIGSIGTVYRASFEGGVSIAVKKLETLGRIESQEEFEQELGRLGGLSHTNLASYQGYYFSTTMQLILSEFVSNGSLYDNLHPRRSSSYGGDSELNWQRRFEIALGTAKALSFLHNDCKPAILHLNVKSANILLDERYEAKLSDYGLEKFLPVLNSFGNFHNAVGYIAPELAQSLRVSDKCDVYSFGVVLLELVTGRKPVESTSEKEVLILRDHVRDLLERGSSSDCFDRRLRGFEENELIQGMKLGLICTTENPLKRPNMAEVVQVLELIRNGMGS